VERKGNHTRKVSSVGGIQHGLHSNFEREVPELGGRQEKTKKKKKRNRKDVGGKG